ncbi:hypothetical protein [Rhizobium chutanense]|uniref:hypothetical protein n=1 Tax=Rhizobium chutanense TaxID=2035448 RepID=UPI001FE03EF6|nr:hypothetical protein [Rhizobium chutanense]
MQFPEVYRPPDVRQSKFGLADLKTVPGNVGVALRSKPIVAPRLGAGQNFASERQGLDRAACAPQMPRVL